MPENKLENKSENKPENDPYPSISLLYEIAKEEYFHQKNRMQNIESKISITITVLTFFFSFEIANLLNVLDIDFKINSWDSFFSFLNIARTNIPYMLSLIFMLISIFMLLFVNFNLKSKCIDLMNLYNHKKIYRKTCDEAVVIYTFTYLACIYNNNDKLNKLYKHINMVIIFAIMSIVFFALSYLF